MRKAMTFSAAVVAAFAGASFIIAQSGPLKVASGHRELLLQTTQAWNGKPHTHYSTGQPQLTTIKLTIDPHTALPWHTHPFLNVVYVLSSSLTLHDKGSGKTHVVHQGEAVGESVQVMARPSNLDATDGDLGRCLWQHR